NVVLPERISDFAIFLEKRSLYFRSLRQFPGEIIPAVAIDCFGDYDLFYSRAYPEIGIGVLKRGLAIAKRKSKIAEDLAYIFRDERRFEEAAEMFKLAAEEGPSSYYCYWELAGAYAELEDSANYQKYLAMFNQAVERERRARR